jgi:signal transduction histidine kinase
MEVEALMDDAAGPAAVTTPARNVLAEPGGVPSEWLDRLLLLQCQLRATVPIERALQQVVEAAREILDDMAVGVCLPSSDAGQIVIRSARACATFAREPDPARLFPELAFEHVVAIRVADGSTLHVATDDKSCLVRGSRACAFVDRVAQMIAANIESHQDFERTLVDLKAQVLQSEKLASIGQIAAGIVHELNNPLTTIMALSDFLQKRAKRRGTEPSDVERLARINEAAERILRFSRDLTDYSRPSKEVPGAVPIHDVIDRALVFCEHELAKTRITVQRDYGEVGLVRGVGGQLAQVFVNLFTNAAHAMRGQGGVLSVSTATLGEHMIVVTVSDEGHGIDAENLPRIFEPFFTTKTDGTGTGLGLSIVRSIVNNHGGRIRVEANDPRGTRFHVELPAAPAPRSVD